MSPITEKYRQAAIIAQTTLYEVILQLHRNIGEQTIGEVCRFGDELINYQINRCYKTVEEKGVARPVEICKNEFINGIAPEDHDTFQAGIVNDGDVLKVTLGVHVDGYTVMAGHTVIIREQGSENLQEPATGPAADAVIGAYLATEAVISLLSSTLSESHALHSTVVSGSVVRQVVDDIAQAFNLLVIPGSKVRRIKRFVAGQKTVQDSLPCVEWREHSNLDETKLIAELDNDFTATPGHTYLIDIQMAPRLEPQGYIKLADVASVGSAIDGPSVYNRDQTVVYQLRTNAARTLLGAIDKQLSVYPFKLSYLSSTLPLNQLKLGLNECIQRHLIVGEPRQKAVFVPEFRPKEGQDVIAARECATVTLLRGKDSGSGYPELLRLSGGKPFPPSWTHSGHTLPSGLAADALNALLSQHQGVKIVEVKPNNGVGAAVKTPADVDVDM